MGPAQYQLPAGTTTRPPPAAWQAAIAAKKAGACVEGGGRGGLVGARTGGRLAGIGVGIGGGDHGAGLGAVGQHGKIARREHRGTDRGERLGDLVGRAIEAPDRVGGHGAPITTATAADELAHRRAAQGQAGAFEEMAAREAGERDGFALWPKRGGMAGR
jgi:hypothetical protein